MSVRLLLQFTRSTSTAVCEYAKNDYQGANKFVNWMLGISRMHWSNKDLTQILGMNRVSGIQNKFVLCDCGPNLHAKYQPVWPQETKKRALITARGKMLENKNKDNRYLTLFTDS